MYYFIPSWYSPDEKWNAHERPWYVHQNIYEFDDTVNQIRMFRNVGEETTLISLAYAPNLRHFLHRQNLYPMPVFSVYDRLQNINWNRMGILSYRDVPWPKHLEWDYMPYHIVTYLHDKIYAQIELSEDGNLLWIDHYEDDELSHRDFYDDRGFLSSVRFYVDGAPARQDFYDPKGDRRFIVSLTDRHVKIVGSAKEEFRQETYDCIEDLITEVLQDYMNTVAPENTIVIASDQKHNQMVLRSLHGQKVVLSYFENRFDLTQTEELLEDIRDTTFLVTDIEHTAKVIREAAGEEGEKLEIYDISPFDTRLSLGRSQRIKELKVFMPLDGLEGELLEIAMKQVFDYMRKNKNVLLTIGTRSADENATVEKKKQVVELLHRLEITDLSVETERKGKGENADILSIDGTKKPRIFFRSYLNETDLINALYDTRLIVDVRDQPDLYLQIAGISAGIPQVNYRFTRYVRHQQDGYIIQNIHYITEALEYYLDGLANWNQALVYCVQEIEKYTGGSLVTKWKKLTGEISDGDQSAAAG